MPRCRDCHRVIVGIAWMEEHGDTGMYEWRCHACRTTHTARAHGHIGQIVTPYFLPASKRIRRR